jgi:hypothetical protein
MVIAITVGVSVGKFNVERLLRNDEDEVAVVEMPG